MRRIGGRVLGDGHIDATVLGGPEAESLILVKVGSRFLASQFIRMLAGGVYIVAKESTNHRRPDDNSGDG